MTTLEYSCDKLTLIRITWTRGDSRDPLETSIVYILSHNFPYKLFFSQIYDYGGDKFFEPFGDESASCLLLLFS